MKRLEEYTDEKGFIGHIDPNGHLEFGDGAQRLGMYFLCTYLLADGLSVPQTFARARFLNSYDSLFLVNGEPVRHWTRENWYGKSGTMSGDQLRAIISCLAIMGFDRQLWQIFSKLLYRGFFAWNTKRIHEDLGWKIPDWVGISTFPTFVRGLISTWWPVAILVNPLITVMDLIFLVPHTLIRMLNPLIDRDSVGDDLNFFCELCVASRRHQTIVSWLCGLFYIVWRPASGSKLFREENSNVLGVVTAFRWYFRDAGAPPLDLLLEDTVRRL